MAISASCSCATEPTAIRADSEFLPSQTLELLAPHPSGWSSLYRCAVCGQRWHVDRFDPGQVGLAIKVPADDSWLTDDDTPVRLAFLIRARGGLSSEPCQWRHCGQPSLKGTVFCPVHAYSVMGVRG